MLQDPTTIEPALDLILISRHLERIGDHATNVAEDVIFMVSARDVRHHPPAPSRPSAARVAAHRHRRGNIFVVSEQTAPRPLCVYCRRHPVEAAYRPFCSKRCQLLDLAHWVDGDYRVAGEPMADDVTIADADARRRACASSRRTTGLVETAHPLVPTRRTSRSPCPIRSSITDNRTGKRYEVPIKDGTIRAMDLRQIKAADDDFGLMTYDPAFTNTASCRSAITYIDGDKGILEYRGYPIEQLAEKSTYLEVAYLLLFGELPTTAQLERRGSTSITHAHDAAREHQAPDARLPLRRASDGRVPVAPSARCRRSTRTPRRSATPRRGCCSASA